MTSQLLLMNHRGVSFSSDSASSKGRYSTNSVQKIFSLPGRQPVAFMVAGSSIFAPTGLSWDRVFYKYNQYFSQKYGVNSELETMMAYENDFLQFLKSIPSDEANNMALYYDLFSYFAGQNGVLSRYVQSEYEPTSDGKDQLLQKIENLQNGLTNIYQNLADISDIEYQIKIKGINENHGEMLGQAATDIVSKLTGADEGEAPDLTGLVRGLLLYHTVQHGEDMSWRASTTTLVFGGFSETEENPSTTRFEVGTLIHGIEPKWIVDRNIVSSNSGVSPRSSDGTNYESRVFIEAFAQSDMIQRLTHGADPRLGMQSDDNIVSNAAGMATQLWMHNYGIKEISKIHGIGDTKANEIIKHLMEESDMLDQISTYHWNWFSAHVNETKEEFREAVDRLSSIELAELGGYLIEIQAKMNQYIRPQATVSLPVDVCVLTKEHGFVWHKLKNMPERNINPKFFGMER
jgi:hypothetical protein